MIQEFRRSRRRKASQAIVVSDAMTGDVVGQIGNLSDSGMLLMANEALINDALYQFRFNLPGPGEEDRTVEIGAHLLWSDQASAPGQFWLGFRFIGLSDQQARLLHAWVETPGSQYA